MRRFNPFRSTHLLPLAVVSDAPQRGHRQVILLIGSLSLIGQVLRSRDLPPGARRSGQLGEQG